MTSLMMAPCAWDAAEFSRGTDISLEAHVLISAGLSWLGAEKEQFLCVAAEPEWSRFIALPRELRDMVYDSLIDENKEPPHDPDHASERDPNAANSPCTIFYEAKSPKPALLQLKLCNRQICVEVEDTLKRNMKSSSGLAKLDIMIKGSSIWPTWLVLPLTPHLDPVININLRIFETASHGSEFSTGAYRALWSFFNRLVFQGPCLLHSKPLQKPLSIDRLQFEILLCFPTSGGDLFGAYRDVFGRLEKLAADNVGLGNVSTIEGRFGADRRVWRLKRLPTGLTLASRQ